MFVPWSKLDRELGSWQCTKHLQSSVDQYAQLIPSLNTFINTHATLYQHLGWHLIDTPSTLCGQQSIESPLIFDWLHMSQSTLWWPQAVRWETLGTRLPTINQLLIAYHSRANWVLKEYQSGCWLSTCQSKCWLQIDWGYWSTLDHRWCIKSSQGFKSIFIVLYT